MTPAPRTWLRLPNWLGDIVAALPVVDAIVEAGGPTTLHAPRAHAGWLARRVPGATVQPMVGRPLVRDARGHDVALLLDGSWRSAFAAWAAGVPRRVGWARGGRGPLLTAAVTPAREVGGVPVGIGRPGRRPRWAPRPFGSAAVELAGVAGFPVAHRVPRLDPGDEVRSTVEVRLEDLGLVPGTPFLLANVGARVGSAKAWPEAHWIELLRDLAGPLPAVLTCGPGEEAATRRIAEASGARALLDPVATVPELAALGGLAAVAVAMDGGARHVLRAGGARTVTLLGPTDPRHTAEHLAGDTRLRVEIPCGPCHRERCPIEGAEHHACLVDLAPARVADAVRQALGDVRA